MIYSTNYFKNCDIMLILFLLLFYLKINYTDENFY